jgi:hypothetical protein
MEIVANKLKPELLVMYATGLVEQALRCGMLLVVPEPEPNYSKVTNSLIMRYANNRFRITITLADDTDKKPGSTKKNGHA